jgi:hypothetical protein
MRLPQFGFRIRTMMILVMISAVILTVWNLVPRAVDPLLRDRSGTIPAAWVSRGTTRHIAVVALLTGLAASPFAIAIVLALKSSPKVRTWRRQTVRWLGVALSLACGLAILNFPLDGGRIGTRLRDGSGIAFYHQYRIWPGEHVTPCLELIAPNGRSRSYPIARNIRYQGFPDIRTDAEQTIVWFIDDPRARVRHGGVWCSINRATGDFVGAGGPYPAGVDETSGFPPSR